MDERTFENPQTRERATLVESAAEAIGDADVVVWDPERTQSLDAAALHMRTDHSPYAGQTATGWPALVLSRGREVARDGRFTGEPAAGRYLARDQVWF